LRRNAALATVSYEAQSCGTSAPPAR